MENIIDIALEFLKVLGTEYVQERTARLLAPLFIRYDARKGEILLEQGRVNRDFIYVHRGLIRQFYYKNGHDITEHFTAETETCFCIESMFDRVPTSLMVEALEDSEIYKISYQGLLDLMETDHQVYLSYCRLQEISLVISQDKADTLRRESAQRSYEHFSREYPQAARRAPLKHIASYLTISPETLSRMLNASSDEMRVARSIASDAPAVRQAVCGYQGKATGSTADSLAVARGFSGLFMELPPTSLELLSGIVSVSEYPKGVRVVAEGDVSGCIYFILKGLVRQFYYKDGKDVTEHFSFEGQRFYCVESVLTGRPSRVQAETLEPCVLGMIPRAALLELTRRDASLARLYRRFLEVDSILSQHKADELRFESARQRYLNFLADFPRVVLRAKNAHVASYLDMTQECLSRLKRQL